VGAAGSSSGGAGTSGGAGSAEELNRELNASLGRFDGAMLGERERMQARAEETGTGTAQAESSAMLDPDAGGETSGEGSYGEVEKGRTSDGKDGGAGGTSGGTAGSGGPGTANDSSSGSGISGVGGGTGRKGDYTHTAAAASAVPADIPNGSDDDVVARQIREAAMKEKDPELREKLWNEYRKYVNAPKGKS
jgi:hypothetical protein